jgi:Pectate lyase superfamily protein
MTQRPDHQAGPISRRKVLVRGAGLASAGLAGALVGTASSGAVAPLPVYNVKDFGARGDQSTNDSAAINAAVQAAQQAGGGDVLFPPGYYLVRQTIHVRQSVNLVGVGWSSPSYPAKMRGSVLYADRSSIGKMVLITGRGSSVRSLALEQNQPPPGPNYAPTDFEDAIHVAGDDVLLRDVHLRNCFRGVRVANNGSGEVGRARLQGISGQPLHTGITIDNNTDVSRISDVHFWPYWSPEKKTYSDPVMQYTLQGPNHGIDMFHSDNPQFSNIFCLGYGCGLFLTESDRPTSKFKLSNADFDYCGIGIYVQASGTTGQITNLTIQGGGFKQDQSREQVGVSGIFAPGGLIQVSNADLRFFMTNAIRAEGGSVMVESVLCDQWNIQGTGFPAIENAGGGTVIVAPSRIFLTGNGGPSTGGAAPVQLDA